MPNFTPDVDVIVPVHTATRPILRAVSSVLLHTSAPVRVTVVAHNIDPEVIRTNLGALADHAGLRILKLADGIASPSGPMNLGLDAATAPYVALLGSDDEFAPGAIDSWLKLARASQATTVIARIDRDISGVDPLPPTRRGRQQDLDPVKDRLTYRCAPLGLISREAFGHLRFSPTLKSGEDLEFTAELWFRGRNIAYDRYGPAYVGHEDELDRVTASTRTVAEDFAFFEVIRNASWFEGLSRKQRQALYIKTLRLHFFDAVLARLNGTGGIAEHRAPLNGVVAQIERDAPGTVALLSRVDRDVIDSLASDDPDPDFILAKLAARWAGGLPAILPRNPLLALHRQGPYRTLRDTRV